jgi:hypothetical protein
VKTPDRPEGHAPCPESVSDGPSPRRSRSPSLLAELLWVCFLMGVPLVTGLVVNAGSGWWAGLVAFVITAILTGFAAYRSDPRRQH